jgi:hypothetical protein
VNQPFVFLDTHVSANLEWELIWDGSGCCKIKNTTNGKMLNGSGAVTNEAAVLQVSDANSDYLRRQIQN